MSKSRKRKIKNNKINSNFSLKVNNEPGISYEVNPM